MRYQALDFLDQFSADELNWILSNARPTTIITAGILIQEGVHSESVFFITDGLFDVHVRDANGREYQVAQIGPGQIVGEISWVDGEPLAATIKAAENSSVLALPIALLNQRVASDGAFALQFFRALARLEALRLRAAGALLANSRQTGGAPASQAKSEDADSLGHQLTELTNLLIDADKRALELKGELPEDLKARVLSDFHTLSRNASSTIYFSGIAESSRAAIGQHMRHEVLPYVQLASLAERFYSKPRGYAGDYLTIQGMYDNTPSGVGRIGPLIDECFLSEPAPKAVRNRRKLLKDQIKQQRNSQNGDVRLTSLACGPAQELFDAFAELGPGELDVTALDIDKEALAILGDRIQKAKVAIRPLHGNLIYLATGRQPLDLPPQDLVYSIGLIDYFNDAFVVKLIDWIFDRLRPGGRVILGNFHPRNPSRAMMDHVLDWRLTYRDESKMNELYSASQFGTACTNILFEEEGINLFAECIKR